jgi:aminoacyl-tRNA hydrolase
MKEINMYLIVGIGNIGQEYTNTRHNVGFMMLDYYTDFKNIYFSKKKFRGLYAEDIIENEKIIYLKPESYVNLSGEVIKKYVDFYKIPIKNILIIVDDINLEIGKLRLREKGSSGGHNGLKNIFLHLGTEDIRRLRIGVSNNKKYNMKDYVLSKFSDSDMEVLNNKKKKVLEIIEEFPKKNFDKLMNIYNRND